MLQIGEAVRKFQISSRSLRYWEERGILKSIRTENSYRCYDEDNLQRIKQILLLRKPEMPIAEIEKVFLTGETAMTVELLNRYLERLFPAGVKRGETPFRAS